MGETQLNKQIGKTYTKIWDNEYDLHEKLHELIENKNWNDFKLQLEIKKLQEDWYRLQNTVYALHDKQSKE